MTRALQPARVIADVAHWLLITVVAVLYGGAYGVVGFYIGFALEVATDGDDLVLTGWLMGWVAIGSVALTLWTLRFTGLGARVVIRRPHDRR